MLFPDGIYYNRERHEFLTSNVSEFLIYQNGVLTFDNIENGLFTN